MEPKRATAHRIVEAAVLAALVCAPVRPLRAEANGVRPGCGGICAHREANASETTVQTGGTAAEEGGPANGPVGRGSGVTLRARSPAGASKASGAAAREKRPGQTLEALDAAESGPVRTEANTAEPSPPSHGIPIPTVHIGVLPRSDHPYRSGLQKTFEVPGESEADASRRKVLMHICVTC